MSAENTDTFDVLLDNSAEAPMNGIAESIAAFKKIPFIDAAHDARLAWGFIGRDLAEQDAKQLASILEGKSVKARVVRSDSIAPLAAAQGVKSLVFDATGLQLTLMSGSIETVTPAQLSVISGFGLPLRSVTKEKIVEGRTNAQKLVNVGLLMAGIPFSVGKKKTVTEKTTVKEDILFYADLLANSPARRFRIDAQNFNYAFLKERMLYNMLLNFKAFLKDLTLWAPNARVNKGTRFLINNLILSQMGYESIAHLEKETLWLSPRCKVVVIPEILYRESAYFFRIFFDFAEINRHRRGEAFSFARAQSQIRVRANAAADVGTVFGEAISIQRVSDDRMVDAEHSGRGFGAGGS